MSGTVLALPVSGEQIVLWDEWVDLDLMDLEEREVTPDARPAGQGEHSPSPMRDEESSV